MPPRDPLALLPLKPFVFHALVVLAGGDRHGWALLRALEARTAARVLPGQLYRQLEAMLDEGLITEHDRPSRGATRDERPPHAGGAAPKRFFRLTPFGRRVAQAEARRLATLVDELRGTGLLPAKGRP